MKTLRVKGISYVNSQMYHECQLVTVINAARYLRLPSIDLRNKALYEKWVDKIKARHGSALRTRLVRKHLGVRITRLKPSWDKIVQSLDSHRPVELVVWHRNTGRHSVLVVDYRELPQPEIRVTNFSIATFNGWMRWCSIDLVASWPKSHKNLKWCYRFDIARKSGRVV